MRILVCGGRDFNNWELIRDTLYPYHINTIDYKTGKSIEIISGMALGADTLAVNFAKSLYLPVHEFHADWDNLGKKAGPIRNQQMLDKGKPDLVIAFPTPKSIGTWDMVRRAKKAGVKTIIVEGGNTK